MSTAETEKRIGVGRAPCHHGELLQGVFTDDRDQRHRALVTLPVLAPASRALFRETTATADGRPILTVFPQNRVKARKAAELTLDRCVRQAGAAEFTGGRLDVSSAVPVGLGMGSSTSDVIAAIRAVGDHYGVGLAPEEIARLAVLAEQASDSIMIEDRVVLFAHREGTVVDVLGYRLPRIVVVGCVTAAAKRLDTLRLPLAEYDERETATFGVLHAALRRAVACADVALLGRVATASARINQRFLPKPELDFLIELCGRLGAAGVQVAHSGTVAGLIFDADLVDLRRRIDACREALADVGIEHSDVFHPGASRKVA